MSKILSKTNLAILLLSSIIVTGCSSDDNATTSDASTIDGTTINTASAVVSAENAEEIGKAAGEAIQVATESDDLPTGIVVNDDASSNMTELDQRLIDAAHATLDTSTPPCVRIVVASNF